MKISIARKLYLLLLPTFVMTVLVGISAWRSLSHGVDDLRKATSLSHEALLSRLYVSEMSDALKGYLLDPSKKSEAERKMKADEMNVAAIEKMATMTTVQKIQDQIKKLGEFDETKLNPAENKVLELVDAGQLPEAQVAFLKEYLPLRQEYNLLSEELASDAQSVSEQEVKEIEDGMTQALQLIILSLAAGTLILAACITVLAVQISKHLRAIATALSTSSDHIENSSVNLSEAGQKVSAGTSEAAASLEETVASVEELSSMVKVNADNAQSAADLSQESTKAALSGQNEIQTLGLAMGELSEASKKIAEITGVIDDIAFQTNLLALNAAVEAARAGEQGKGFAVVAEAVRELAQRSAVAAKDISNLIKESSAKTLNAVEVTSRSGKVLQTIVGTAEKVAQLNGEISAASREQSNGISQISQAMQELDRSTQNNAVASDQVATEAGEVADQAQGLRQMVLELRKLVEGDSTAGTAREVVTMSAPTQKTSAPKSFPKTKPTSRSTSNSNSNRNVA